MFIRNVYYKCFHQNDCFDLKSKQKILFLIFSAHFILIPCFCTANKQKWVPLEIDLVQNRGTMRSPRFQNHRERNGEGKKLFSLHNNITIINTLRNC